jgi:hypothetical protein
MGRGSTNQSHRASAEEIQSPPGPYCYPRINTAGFRFSRSSLHCPPGQATAVEVLVPLSKQAI